MEKQFLLIPLEEFTKITDAFDKAYMKGFNDCKKTYLKED